MELSQHVKKFQELGVLLLLAFGSRHGGTARHDSDRDIGVLFSDVPTHPRRYGELYALLETECPLERIDLIDFSEASCTLQYRAAMEGKVLYAVSPSTFADFREHAMRTYFDFLPVLAIYEEALGIPPRQSI